jgi:hypothetical protein
VRNALADFIDEIRAAPQFRAAVARDAVWAQQLADWQDTLSTLANHAGVREIAVHDEIMHIIARKSAPVGERMKSVHDALAKAHYAKHPRPN